MVEEKILSYVLKSKENLLSVYDDFLPEYFIRYHWLCQLVRKYYQKFGQILTSDVMVDIFKRRGMTEERITENVIAFNRIIEVDVEPAEIEYLLNRLRGDYLKEEILQRTRRILENWESQEGTEILDQFSQSFIELRNHKSDQAIVKNVVEDVDTRKKLYLDVKQNPEKYRGVYIGLRAFDQRTNGIRKDELAVLVSGTGEGKSIGLLNFAYNAWLSGKNVLFFTLEMPVTQIERRFDARYACLEYTKIRDGALSPEEEKIYFEKLEEIRSRSNKLMIIDIPRHSTTSTIDNHVQKYQKEVDFVLIDYLGLLAPSAYKEADWLNQGTVTEECRDIARRYHIPIFTAAQITREGRKKKVHRDTTHIAQSDLIPRTADIVVSLTQEKIERGKGRARMEVLKYRDGEPFKFSVFVDFTRMIIGDLTPEVEEWCDIFEKTS